MTIAKLAKIIIGAFAVLLVISVVMSCVYKVSEQEEAVLLTLGKYTDTKKADLYFKLPLGIQTVYKVPTNRILSFPIGFDEITNDTIDSEAKMITGDFNIVYVDFIVEYKISDAKDYLFASTNPEMILKNLIQSAIKSVVSDYTIDEVITTEKDAIQTNIKTMVQEELVNYKIGLALSDIKLQDTEVPSVQVSYEGSTVSVSQAFDAVESARQNATRALNDAAAYESTNIAQARSEADKIVQDAEAYAVDRENEAKRQVNMFNTKFEDYIKNPEIAKTRMFYETLNKTLGKAKIYIDTSEGSGGFSSLPIIREFKEGN